MLSNLLKNKHLILGSGSPRRKFFLEELKLDFEIRLKEVDECYPDDLRESEISDYLALLKAVPFKNELKHNDVLITADTIVWYNNTAIGKPKNAKEAKIMLASLSGNSHKVISSVAITTTENQVLINDVTTVKFKKLRAEEIDFYIDNFKPFDKAGSYGIQEWIGYIGIEKIDGNFFNVMGFPIQKFYEMMIKI